MNNFAGRFQRLRPAHFHIVVPYDIVLPLPIQHLAKSDERGKKAGRPDTCPRAAAGNGAVKVQRNATAMYRREQERQSLATGT